MSTTDPSSPTRREHDALGAVDLPAGAPWGIHTARSVDALSFSGRALGQLPDLVRGLGHAKAAAARANARAGALRGEVASAIEDAAHELAKGVLADGLVADPLAGGGGIAVHVNVNEVLANRANQRFGRPFGTNDPVDPKRDVAASQSTADVLHAAGRLALLDAADRLGATLDRVAASIDAVAERAGSAPTLSRTCLQDGLAVEARLLFDGTATTLRRAIAGLEAATRPLADVVLGATVVGTGAGAPDGYRDAVVDELALVTGRRLTRSTDPAAALQQVDDVLAVVDATGRVATVAAKLARDLRLLSSGPHGGFGEVQLPAVMEGSAFFVGKVNPAVPETVIQATIQVAGLGHAAHVAADLGELHLHGWDLALVVAALDQLVLLDRALGRLTTHCLDGLAFDEDRGRALASHAAATKEPR